MKKDIKYYMSLPYRLEITQDPYEGGYVLEYPELPGCLSCADKKSEILYMAEDAKLAWLTSALNAGDKIPEPIIKETILA